MLRVTPYVLVLAACIVFGCCTPKDEEFGDAVAVVDRHIDVREIIHFKRRNPEPEQVAEHDKVEDLYFQEDGKRKLLKAILSGMHVYTDTGKVEVCGPPNAKIDITWSPKVLDVDGNVTVFIDMITPVEIKEAKINMDVYIDGVPGPAFSIAEEVKCPDIKKRMPYINCPIAKGLPIKFQITEQMKNMMTGTYSVVANIKNERGELFACLKLKVTIERT